MPSDGEEEDEDADEEDEDADADLTTKDHSEAEEISEIYTLGHKATKTQKMSMINMRRI